MGEGEGSGCECLTKSSFTCRSNTYGASDNNITSPVKQSHITRNMNCE